MAQPSANNERIEEHIVESTASLAAQNDRPSLSQSPLQASPSEPPSPSAAQLTRTQSRTNTIASIASTRLRSASIKMMEADAPLGMWAAAGSAASKAPTLGDIRRGSFRDAGWNQESQMADGRENQRRASLSSARRMSQGSQRGVLKRIGSANAADIFPQPIEEVASERTLDESISPVANGKSSGSQADVATKSSTLNSIKQNPVLPGPGLPPDVVPNEDGYYIPPKVPWTTSTAIGLRGFFKWVLTPVGFLITLYCCNVVAWGGMLFLLLCNASKAMCRPTCNDINSPRRIWIEIDSQILNALFCVTGFGTRELSIV
jgi:hypothetical protein